MYNILCFGDSNTYGYRPDKKGRFDENTRWTRRVQNILGDKYHIIEEGLCGRTTVFEDKLRPRRKGIDDISMIMETHNPLDFVIVMLGTNDCKTVYNAKASDIAKGIKDIILKISNHLENKSNILLISPIHLGKDVGEEGYDPEFDSKSEEVSRNLSAEYEKVSKNYGCAFLDASKIASPSDIDREHLDEKGHKALAQKVSEIIKNLTKENISN